MGRSKKPSLSRREHEFCSDIGTDDFLRYQSHGLLDEDLAGTMHRNDVGWVYCYQLRDGPFCLLLSAGADEMESSWP